MINGAFPRHSVSTSSNTNSNDCYYRHSLDDDRLGTPQRVHRKPVPRQSPVQENNWKIATKKKDYSAADTIHPNRICTYNQVKPSQEKASQPTRPHSLQPQSTQPRHHPQKHKSSSVPLVASSVTPAVEVPPPQKLKQSASAIPGAMDQVVVRIRKYSQGSSITPNFWYPRADRDITEPVKQALTKKIRGLLQPHRIQIEGASKDVNQKDIEASIARPKTPTQKTMDNPFNALR
jgi:hypothetical protein